MLFACPRPSWPFEFEPQHFSEASSSTAHTKECPTATWCTALPVPRSMAGKWSPICPALSPTALVSPLPSCPTELSPQHFKLSSSSNAHPKRYPSETWRTDRPAPKSTVGKLSPISPPSSPTFEVCPRPSCPTSFLPQHFNVSLFSMAQEHSAPTSSCVANWPPPRSTAFWRKCWTPSRSRLSSAPRLPAALSPQHLTLPPTTMAQTCRIVVLKMLAGGT